MQVIRCERSQVAAALQTAHVAVPLMSRLDRQLLLAGPKLRLILQFGVGMEGVDLDAVRLLYLKLVFLCLCLCLKHP